MIETPSRILVVDDEPSITEFVSYALKKEGYEIDVVDNGEDAFALASTNNYDLFVLDIMLPGIDGYELCRRLRSKTTAPVLFLSARDTELDKVVGLEIGGDDYLAKPFGVRELIARVRALLRRASGQEMAPVSNTITASNKIRREKGHPTLDFAWTGINFVDKMPVTVKAPDDSSIPDSTIDLIEDLREIAVTGAFGEGAVAVCIPSRESYDAQYAAAYAEARAKAEAEAAAAAEAAEAEKAAEAVALAEGLEEEAAAGDAAEELVAQMEGEEAAADESLAEEERLAIVPEFDVDYTLWSVTYADGTVKTYDSAKAEFVD